LSCVAGSGTSKVRSTQSAPQLSNRLSRGLRESTLDPQLGPYIKTEDQSRSGTPMGPYGFDAGIMNRSYTPLMGSGPHTPYTVDSTMNEPSVLDSITTSDSDSLYGETAPRKNGRKVKRVRSMAESNNSNGNNRPSDLPGQLSEMVHVSDTKFPFDGVFTMDAATDEGKRMRNQKKDDSALTRLENVSKSIFPREVIYVMGQWRRDREITGVPNSDDGLSDISGEEHSAAESSPPKKKRATRVPKAAYKKPTNTREGKWFMEEIPDQKNSSGTRRVYHPLKNNAEAKDVLTFSRSGVQIHHDGSGPAITMPSGRPTFTTGLQQRQAEADYSERVPYIPGHYGLENPNFGRPLLSGPVVPDIIHHDRNNPLAFRMANIGSFGKLNASMMYGGHGNGGPDGRGAFRHRPEFGGSNPLSPTDLPQAPIVPSQTTDAGFSSYTTEQNFTQPQRTTGMTDFNTTAPRTVTDTFESFMEDFAHFNDPMPGVDSGLPQLDETLFLGGNQQVDDDDATVSMPTSGV